MRNVFRYVVICEGSEADPHTRREIAAVTVTASRTPGGDEVREATAATKTGRASWSGSRGILDGYSLDLACPKCHATDVLGRSRAVSRIVEELAEAVDGKIPLRLLRASRNLPAID